MRAGTRFANAKQQALEQLARRPGDQKAQIVAFGAHMQVLTQPLQDGAALHAALESIQPGDEHGSFGELGRGLRALAENASEPVEAHFFSDLQNTAMPANFADLVLPRSVSLHLHPVGNSAGAASSSGGNWTVESVVAPAQLPDPKDLKRSHVQAVIVGYDTPAATRTVSLLINGKVTATRKVEVPANGRATVEFAPLDVPYGFSRCAIKLDAADGFAADDQSVFAVQRSDPARVLLVHGSGDARSGLYFGTALAAAAQTSYLLQQMDASQTADVDPSKYAFVVLADAMQLPSIFENNLSQYVRNGGSVLVAAGTSAGHRVKIPIFGGNADSVKDYARNGSYAEVGRLDQTHPAIHAPDAGDTAAAGSDEKGATAGDIAGWADVKVFYAVNVDPGGAKVIARLTDGTPLLMDKQVGEGHVLLLASGLDNLTNDLPLHPVFVLFVDQASRYLSGSERLSGVRQVDAFVQLHSQQDVARGQGASVEVIDPDGQRPLSLSEASRVQSFALTKAGFYQIHFPNGKDALLGVNPDRRESALAPMAEDVQQLWVGASGTQPDEAPANAGQPAQPKSQPFSIWWYIMLLAFLALLAETIVASGHLGTQREEA
jgi:hypothetical protein